MIFFQKANHLHRINIKTCLRFFYAFILTAFLAFMLNAFMWFVLYLFEETLGSIQKTFNFCDCRKVIIPILILLSSNVSAYFTARMVVNRMKDGKWACTLFFTSVAALFSISIAIADSTTHTHAALILAWLTLPVGTSFVAADLEQRKILRGNSQRKTVYRNWIDRVLKYQQSRQALLGEKQNPSLPGKSEDKGLKL